MKKTVVQKLKDDVFKLLDGVTLKSQMDNILLNTFFDKAEKEEKEQIIEDYENGKQNGIESITNVNKYIIGEYYYNQTYNQNK